MRARTELVPCPANLYALSADPSACLLVVPEGVSVERLAYQTVVEAKGVERARPGEVSVAPRDSALGDTAWLSERIRELCREDPRTRVYLDLAMGRAELYQFYRRHGKFPVHVLRDAGALTECTVLLNPFWLASWEREMVALSSAKIVLSVSDATAAGSVPLIGELSAAGVAYGFGTGARGGLVVDEMRAAVMMLRYSAGKVDEERVVRDLLTAAERVLGRAVEARVRVRVLAGSVWETLVRYGFASYEAVVERGRELRLLTWAG